MRRRSASPKWSGLRRHAYAKIATFLRIDMLGA